MRELPALAKIRAAYEAEIGPSVRRFFAAALVLALFGGALVSRVGTLAARVVGAAALFALLVFIVARAIVLARRRRSARAIVATTVAAVDPLLAASTLRAITLTERVARDPSAGSIELAELHLSRLVQRTSMERLVDRAESIAERWSAIALGLAAVAVVAVALEPFKVVEGLDVAVASRGVAPLSIPWLDDVEIVATPPEYLHQPAAPIYAFSLASLPRGTTLAFRGTPVHAGRRLVVTDGAKTEAFTDDGAGGLVARWTLGDSASLHIAAVFGDVRIDQADAQSVESIADRAPVVKVEGAPRTTRLLDEPAISIHYEATDDHGLREVDLVLRAGTKEERRVLSRPAADATIDRGGYELRASDAFFARTFVPVEVRVEARDNDLVAGPKWGKSPSIIVIPPQVGEPEALRFAALAKARDALADMVADRIDMGAPKPADRAAHAKKEHDAEARLDAVNTALESSYGALTVRGRFARLARGQLRVLATAFAKEQKLGTPDAHDKLLEASEIVLLAFASGVRGLAARDAKSVAKRLADVADEVAAGANLEAQGGDKTNAEARMDAAVQVLDGGGKQLLVLDTLGKDLGEIVAADLRRVARARGQGDLAHAELAARDLAARLRDGSPSFSGGSSHAGGVESGGAPTPDLEQASNADEQQAQQDEELERLRQDHAAAENDVADALDKAASPEELEELKQEMKQRAEELREAIKNLPKSEGDPSTAEGSASAGREQAEAMAAELDRGSPKEAVESGRKAKSALDQAEKLGRDAEGFFPEERAGRAASRANETLQRELAWAEEQVDRLRRNASQRAKKDLDDASKREHELAERAKKLAERGASGDGAMPDEQIDRLEQAEQKMRDAERALGQSDGENGMKQQDEAQRLLEMAQGERENDSSSGDQEAEKGGMAKKTDIPKKDEHKGPEDFRKRVLKGLSGSSDPVLREAVKRYAEGLLK